MANNGQDRLSILFVDDSQDDAKLTAGRMKKTWNSVPFRVVQTEAALSVALEDNSAPDVILCDYFMPNLTPLRALQIVHESRHPDTPFIVYSGTVSADSELEVLKRGAHDFAVKPPFDDSEEDKRLWNHLIWIIKREIRRAGERMQRDTKMSSSYEMTVEAWGMALELRDKHTQGHTLRVTDLTLRYIRKYVAEISHDEFVNIHRGALLHDVGKMGVSDTILNKPGPLDDDELAVMRMHPRLAYEMLRHIPFLQDALNIPYCHHEKWSGLGYPRGLKGEEIPIEARIFSVMDVYDAVTSSRPYRDTVWEKDRALMYIESEKGKSFDPAVVDKFLEMMKQ
jgi:putative two-component system response regulator